MASRGHGREGRGFGRRLEASAPDGSGRGSGSGRGRGGRGAHGGAQDQPKPADTEAAEVEDETITKEQVGSLRSFSEPKWWTIGPGSVEVSATDDGKAPRQKRMKREAFQKQCEDVHAQLTKVYDSTMMNDSEQRWLRKVSSEGTAGDRVASLTMLIQVCPVFATKYIKALLGMASKMARSDAVMALDALKDAFVTILLPDRKLRTMSQVEPASKTLDQQALTELYVVTYFEDFLKTAFAAFVQLLGEAGHNSIVFFKTKAIKTAFELLSAKPEQERALLALLVNKFGDLMSKVSSNVSFHLKKLVDAHPGMKLAITKEIEIFLSRPNVTAKSKYCAVLLLSEFILTRGRDKELAARIVKVYVGQLERTLKPAEPEKRKKGDREKRSGGRHKMQKKRKAVKGGMSEDDSRFIRTLINGIQRVIPYLDATVTGSPIHTEIIDTLFTICHTVSAFSTRIAILSLLFKILIALGDLPDRFYRLLYEQLLQFDLFQSAHRLQAFILLRKCIPVDASVGRGVAVMRRLLQVGAMAEPPVAAAGLAIVRELFVARRAEMKQLIQNVDAKLQSKTVEVADDAEEERFVDDDAPAAAKDGQGEATSHRYQPLAREPRHAKAQNTPLWELWAMAGHVHPFISHGATKLLSGETFEDAAENPFQEFSTGELLEQFAYASSKPRTKRGEQAEARLPYNSDKFMRRKTIRPHERFFHQYFKDSTVQQQQKRKAALRKQNEDDVDEENEDGGDADAEEQEDRFFDSYIEDQMPKGEFDCDADEDDDSDDPDMDDSDAGSDDDDDADDDGGAGSDDSMAARIKADGAGSGDDEEDSDPDDDDDSGDGSGGGDPENEAPGGTGRQGKRKADMTRKDKVKAIKKKHSGSLFASAEDFTSFLNEDFT